MTLTDDSVTTQHLLHRLDWRFLLPQPNLRHIAYWGPPDSNLAAALKKFCRSFTIFPEAGGRENSLFDCVVLVTPARSHLQTASRRLAPEGSLYAEFTRTWDWRKQRQPFSAGQRLQSLDTYRETLKQLGFAEVKIYWHEPDFDNAAHITPVEHLSAMQFVAVPYTHDWKSRLKFPAVMQSSWFAKLLLPLSIVACKRRSREHDSQFYQTKLAALGTERHGGSGALVLCVDDAEVSHLQLCHRFHL